MTDDEREQLDARDCAGLVVEVCSVGKMIESVARIQSKTNPAALSMDADEKDLLRQILIVQQEQAAVIKRYLPPLWTKIRFSLLAMLALMTVTAVVTALTAYRIRSGAVPAPIAPAPARVIFPAPVQPGTEVRPGQPILILPPSAPAPTVG